MKFMVKLLSDKKLQERAKELSSVREDFGLSYSDKSALYAELIAPANKEKKNKRRIAYKGHLTRNNKICTGLASSRRSVESLYPATEIKVKSSFIDSYAYCAEANVLKITIRGIRYCYFHVTQKDMDRLDMYDKFSSFYHAEVHGAKDSVSV